jgi:predicted MFS family arabinose efflux permease
MQESARATHPYGQASAARIALASFMALAVAMGIGRFAFTPLLPMMMADGSLAPPLTLTQGGWLASANYAGYFIGALTAGWLAARRETLVVRLALTTIAMTTLAMGLTHDYAWWLALRLLAGVASAYVMVYGSAWALRELTRRDAGPMVARMYGGVGAGIAAAGLVVLLMGWLALPSRLAWMACSGLALLLSAIAWPALSAADPAVAAPQGAESGLGRHAVLFVLCYGAYGLGYIIPATFIPAMAREAVPDPAVFNWVWPLFGAVAVASTLGAAAVQARVSSRTLWMATHVAMATGVALLAIPGSMTAIVLSALCVGGSFMVTNISAFRLAHQVTAPDATRATRLIGAMTAAFALGQIIGPLCLAWLAGSGAGILPALALAVAGLLLSAWALGRTAL